MKYIGPLAFVAIIALLFESWTVFIIGSVLVIMIISSDTRESRNREQSESPTSYDQSPAHDVSEVEAPGASDVEPEIIAPILYMEGRKYYRKLLDRRRRWKKKYEDYYESLPNISRTSATSYSDYVTEKYYMYEDEYCDDMDFDDPDKVDELEFVSDEYELYSDELEKYGVDYDYDDDDDLDYDDELDDDDNDELDYGYDYDDDYDDNDDDDDW